MGLFTKRVLNRVISIPVDMIESNPFQPRLVFDESALKELAQSIEENGLLQPVTVRKVDDRHYELIAGERRLQACRMIKKDEIAAIVEDFTDEQAAVFAMVENLQRKDLNYFEEARGIQILMHHHGLTQQQIANQLGKAQSTVANKLRLLQFGKKEQSYMLQTGLTERHARALLKLVNTKQLEETMQYIVANRLNVGETERYIEKLIQSGKPAQPQKPPATRLFVVKDLRIFMNTITKAVDTMKLAGIEIDTEKEENEEYINYTMRIPKKSAYRQGAEKQHSASTGGSRSSTSRHYSA